MMFELHAVARLVLVTAYFRFAWRRGPQGDGRLCTFADVVALARGPFETPGCT